MKYKFTLTRTVTDIAEVEVNATSHRSAIAMLTSRVRGKRVAWLPAEDEMEIQLRDNSGVLRNISAISLDDLTEDDIKEALEE